MNHTVTLHPDAEPQPRSRRADARPPRVLVDLSHTAEGYVGIAQDTRLIFGMLAGRDDLDASGLLMPTGRHDLPRMTENTTDALARISGVLHWMGRGWAEAEVFAPGPLRRPLRLLREARRTFAGRHRLLAAPEGSPGNTAWRMLFEKTLPPSWRERVLARPFLATDLSVARIIARTMHLPFLPPQSLAAEGFDAVLFSFPRPVRLPPGVRPLVRFHDAVPLTDVDTVENWRSAAAHQALVRACAPHAVFVCNSPQSMADLVRLDPRRAGRCVMIPCALAPRRPPSPRRFADIVASRRTLRALPAGSPEPALPDPAAPPPAYVVAVGTLEPRKNFTGLVRAWERAVLRGAPELRLVIVAGTGWREQEALDTMRPHIASGRLLHLQGLPADELQAILRGASCFAFPSFNEGFGYPPLEALQEGVPSVVSDIPVFRWIFGGGALYADPYDLDDLAAQILRLAGGPDSASLRADLLSRRDEILARFRPETVAEQWAALLTSLSADQAQWLHFGRHD